MAFTETRHKAIIELALRENIPPSLRSREAVDKLRQVAIKSGKPMEMLNSALRKSGLSLRRFNRDASGRFVKPYYRFLDKTSGTLHDVDDASKIVIGRTKRFRAEWLSVMFLGMGISRVFGNVTKGALDMAGGQQFLSEAINITMLPAALDLNDAYIAIGEALMGLPEPIQKGIGWFALLAEGIGSTLQTVGFLTLGLSGLEQVGLFQPGTMAGIGTSIRSYLKNPIGESKDAVLGLKTKVGELSFTSFIKGLSSTQTALIGFGAAALAVIGYLIVLEKLIEKAPQLPSFEQEVAAAGGDVVAASREYQRKQAEVMRAGTMTGIPPLLTSEISKMMTRPTPTVTPTGPTGVILPAQWNIPRAPGGAGWQGVNNTVQINWDVNVNSDVDTQALVDKMKKELELYVSSQQTTGA